MGEENGKMPHGRCGTMQWTPRLVPIHRAIEVTHIVHVSDKRKKSGYVFSGEMHDFWEFVLVCEGNARATADDRIYTLHSGRLLIHKPMEFHSIRSADETDLHLIIGSFCLKGEILPFFAEKLLPLSAEEQARFVRAITCMIEAEKQNSAVMRQEGVSMFEMFLLRQYEKGALPVCENEIYDERYQKILHVLHENAEKPLRQRDIARLCRMSESALKKTFAAHDADPDGDGTRGGIMHFFGKIKLSRAAALLENGMPVRAVAEKLSFSSVEYFHLAFKREFGITPGQYRKKKRETD